MTHELISRASSSPLPLPFALNRRVLAIQRAAAQERVSMREAQMTGVFAMGQVVQLKATQHEYEVLAPDCTELLGFIANGVGVAIGNRAIQFASQVGA